MSCNYVNKSQFCTSVPNSHSNAQAAYTHSSEQACTQEMNGACNTVRQIVNNVVQWRCNDITDIHKDSETQMGHVGGVLLAIWNWDTGEWIECFKVSLLVCVGYWGSPGFGRQGFWQSVWCESDEKKCRVGKTFGDRSVFEATQIHFFFNGGVRMWTDEMKPVWERRGSHLMQRRF